MPVQTLIQLRRGTTTEWTTANPVLLAGELGYDSTVKDFKMGDGTTLWASLPFVKALATGSLNGLMPAADKARFDLSLGGYKSHPQTDQPTAYPLGVSQFLGEVGGAGGWDVWPTLADGQAFVSITTIRDKTYTGGALQIAAPYAGDGISVPLGYRTFSSGGTDWNPWQNIATTAVATSSANGLMPAADKAKMDAATSSGTASTLLLRDTGGSATLNTLIVSSAPSNVAHATRKDYVDTAVALKLDKAAVNMSTAQDLNTYVTSGDWNVAANATASGGTNYPVPFSGMLKVTAVSGGANVIQQYTRHATSNDVYIRGFYASVWSAWKRFTMDGDGLVTIVAGTDLDTITTPGEYMQGTTANATLLLHYPDDVAGRLIVKASGTTHIFQEYTTFNSTTLQDAVVTWSRAQYSAGAWSAWKRTTTDMHEVVLNMKDYAPLGDGVTSENTQVLAACAEAYATSTPLHWPNGTWVVTGNIPNFHAIRHVGPGAVKRGTDVFYVDPRLIQPNTLYVATTTASDTNDGITRAFALRTTNKAIDTLSNYGPVVDGIWGIQLDVATYTDRVTCPKGLDAVSPITIRGPIVNHPNVPTAIYKEGYNVGAVAFDFTDAKASFIISNIKFEGYNGTTSSAGVKSSSNEGNFYLVNCHFTDNYWGTTNQSGPMDIKGGIFTRNGFLGDTANNVAMASRNGTGGGYRGLMGSKHSIGLQSAGVLTNGPYFYSNRSGVFAQETCTGHVDWCTFEDNDFGVNINVNSRANVDGSSFKRNNFALRAVGNSHFYVSSNVVFGTGVDENGVNISTPQGSQFTDESRMFTNLSQSYNTTLKIVDSKFPNQSISTTTATTFYTLTLGAGMWRDVINSIHDRKRIVFKLYGELLGTAGTKEITVRLGTGNVKATFSASEAGIFEAESTIFFTDVATQLATLSTERHLATNIRRASTQMTNAMTSNTNLTLEALVSVATDTIRIDAIDVSWG